MLTGVCTWFRPKGRLTADQVAALYTRMVVDAVSGSAALSRPGE